MERDDDPIDLLPEGANVGFESSAAIHRAARQVHRRRAPAIPKVTEQTDAPPARLSDNRRMSRLLIGTCTQSRNVRKRQRFESLQNSSPSTIEQMIVRESHHIYSRSSQRGGKFWVQDRKSTRLNSSHRCISY